MQFSNKMIICLSFAFLSLGRAFIALFCCLGVWVFGVLATLFQLLVTWSNFAIFYFFSDKMWLFSVCSIWECSHKRFLVKAKSEDCVHLKPFSQTKHIFTGTWVPRRHLLPVNQSSSNILFSEFLLTEF